MHHPFFGELRSDAGYLTWDGTIQHGGRTVAVDLDCEDDADLELAARFVREVARFDARARAALDLDEDDEGVPSYLERHQRAGITREDFLERLVLVRIWFALDDPDSIAVFDYTNGGHDEVLAVRFDAAGTCTGVACER